MEANKITISNRLIRNALRIPAWVLLMIYGVSRIAIPVVKAEPIYLDTNDGYVIFGCMALLLGIEAVKAAINKWITKKTS